MATFRGRDGAAEVGADAVVALQSWSYTETLAVLESDSMGDTWGSTKSDLKNASGDIVYLEDDGTGNGQDSITVGAEVTLKLYSQGTATGKTYRTGPAKITEISAPVSKGDVVTVTASWRSEGAWTTAVVPA